MVEGKKVEVQDWRLTTIVADVDTDAGAGAGQGFWPGITTNALGADRQIAGGHFLNGKRCGHTRMRTAPTADRSGRHTTIQIKPPIRSLSAVNSLRRMETRGSCRNVLL